MTDARQRAREAASEVFAGHVDAIEAYFDERVRGEAGDNDLDLPRDYDTGYAHGIRDTEAERDQLRARVAELEAERDAARDALDSIGDMLIGIEGAMTGSVSRVIARCIEDAKWRKQPEFSERPASLRKRVAELEAVVRAADAMRDDVFAHTPEARDQLSAYDTARAKVEVPGE